MTCVPRSAPSFDLALQLPAHGVQVQKLLAGLDLTAITLRNNHPTLKFGEPCREYDSLKCDPRPESGSLFLSRENKTSSQPALPSTPRSQGGN